jgi:hypothetical protein
MYAGGLSYVSSGSVRASLCGGSRAEAVASPDSKTKEIKKRAFDTIKHLKLKKLDRIPEHTRGVHQIFLTQNQSLNETRTDLDNTPFRFDPFSFSAMQLTAGRFAVA